ALDLVERQDEHGKDEALARGNRRDVICQADRIGCRIEIHEMMFADQERIEAHLVGQLHGLDQFRIEIVDVMAVMRPVSREFHTELHLHVLLVVMEVKTSACEKTCMLNHCEQPNYFRL